MKKKLLIASLLALLFVCIFAITAFAAEIPDWTEITEVDSMPDKDKFGTDGTKGATSRVLMSDGITYPAYYICKNQTSLSVDLSALNSATGKSYNKTSVVRLEVPKGTTSSPMSALKADSDTGFTALVTASFPEGFTTMGGYTFKSTTTIESSLVYVSLPSTLTTFGTNEFIYCDKLEELIIPEGTTTIPTSFAYGTTSLKKLVLPSTIEKIAESAFRSAGNIENVIIPEGCVTIESYAFKESGVINVVVPSTVTSIGTTVFTGCPNMKTLHCKVSKIPASTFSECYALETVILENTVEIGEKAFRYAGIKDTIDIPEGCTTIGQYAFNGSSVKKVILPSTLKSLGVCVFSECHSLTDVNSNSSIIAQQMFYRCENVTNVVLNNVVTIGKQAFNNDQDNLANRTTKIVGLVLPEGLTSIGDHAFTRCAITEIVLPSTLTTVGSAVFSGCASLEKVVVLGTCTGASMFQYCSALDELVLTESFTSFGSSNPLDAVCSTQFTTYYTGTDHSRIKTVCSKSTRLSNATYCSYEDYMAGNYTTNKYNYYVLYDVNVCVAAFDGVHTESKDDGDCTTALLCSICKEHVIKAALSHISSERVTYVSFLEAGEHYIGCTNDGCTVGTTTKLNPLFTCLGYSYNEVEKGSVSIGYSVDHDAIKKYKELTGEDISYGLFIGVGEKLGQNDIFDLATNNVAEGVLAANFSNSSFNYLKIKVVGFETETQKTAQFVIGAFVVNDNKLSYLQETKPQSGKYSYVSYKQLVG